jgi:hypothetical protein
MVSVAVRAAPALAATVMFTVPVPAPLAGLTVTQAAPLVAVHPQEAPLDDTVTALVPPEAAALNEVADSEEVHDSAACVTASVWPSTVSFAVLAAPELAATVIATVPEPDPIVGLTVNQGESLAAVQEQVDALAESPTVDDPPAAGAAHVEEASPIEHEGAPSVTVKVCPAIVSTALRAADVLAAAVTVTVPDPVPLAGLTAAHNDVPNAVQAQDEALAVTVSVVVPPAAAAAQDVDDRV